MHLGLKNIRISSN